VIALLLSAMLAAAEPTPPLSPNVRITDTTVLGPRIARYLHDENARLHRKVYLRYSVSADASELFLRVDCNQWNALKTAEQRRASAAANAWWRKLCLPSQGYCAVEIYDSCNHVIVPLPHPSVMPR
jgi:hypothetical protein